MQCRLWDLSCCNKFIFTLFVLFSFAENFLRPNQFNCRTIGVLNCDTKGSENYLFGLKYLILPNVNWGEGQKVFLLTSVSCDQICWYDRERLRARSDDLGLEHTSAVVNRDTNYQGPVVQIQVELIPLPLFRRPPERVMPEKGRHSAMYKMGKKENKGSVLDTIHQVLI